MVVPHPKPRIKLIGSEDSNNEKTGRSGNNPCGVHTKGGWEISLR
jgi:hypothetical protein